MTINSTALFAIGFGMLVLLATVIWASAPDIALALIALADI